MLSHKHVKLVSFLQSYTFSLLQHKIGKTSVVAHALSSTYHLLITMINGVVWFEEMKGEYAADPSFNKIIEALNNLVNPGKSPSRDYLLAHGFLCRGGPTLYSLEILKRKFD